MKTMLNIKTEKKTKKEAQKIAKSFGLSLSAIINHYLEEFITERQIIFTDHPMPNKKTQKLFSIISKDIKESKNTIVGPFDSADEMLKSLKG